MNDTLEFVILEELLNDVPECQAEHNTTNICTIEVVYVGSDCVESVLLCENSVDGPQGIRTQMITGTRCQRCMRLAEDCWEIRPV